MKPFLLTFTLSLLSLFKLHAQLPATMLRVGTVGVRGETTTQPIMKEDYGFDISGTFMYPLANEQFNVFAEVNYSTAKLEDVFSSNYYFKNGAPSNVITSSVGHAYFGAGMRFYLTGEVRRFNPYFGQILPFVGLSAGFTHISTDVDFPTGYDVSFDIAEKSFTEFAFQLDGGVVFVLDKQWAVELYGAARPGISDYYDGIKGISDVKDWLVRLGVGVQYRLD